MIMWVSLTVFGLFLNILRPLMGGLSKSQPELPDLSPTNILALFIYLMVMIYLIIVVVSYKAEIESRSNTKPLPFQVVFFVAICWTDDFISNSQLRLFLRLRDLHRHWTSQASGASGKVRMFPTSNINHLSEPAVSAMFTPDLSVFLC